MEISKVDFSSLLKELTDIGVALSVEKDHGRLLEMILIKAMEVTNADGGSLYTHTEDRRLKFEIMLTKSLDVHKGGTSGEAIEFYPISLYGEDGKPNDHMVAAWAAISATSTPRRDAPRPAGDIWATGRPATSVARTSGRAVCRTALAARLRP